MLYGCSDDNTASAPGIEKREANTPVAAVVQPGPRPENEGKQEAREIEKERPLKIGVIGPETGNEARYGLSVLKGVLAAAGRFHSQGGLGGSKIEVLHYDNKSDPGLTRVGCTKPHSATRNRHFGCPYWMGDLCAYAHGQQHYEPYSFP